jgi:putative transposase
VYPTKAQVTVLDRALNICCDVYNSLVNERTALYEIVGKSPDYYAQKKEIATWKPQHPELTLVHSQVLQDVCKRVDLAFQSFFRRVKSGEEPGYPRFRGKGWYDSLTYPQYGKGCEIRNGVLWLSKIGEVKIKLHRPIMGEIKTCSLRRLNNKWFACFSVDADAERLPESAERIGVDVGIENFATLSDGSKIANPRFFRNEEAALAKSQRKLSKQAKGSKERRKARKVVVRVHERIRNRRHDFVHQTARRLVNKYGVIAVEDLNVKGMLKHHSLAKSTSDASWSMFRSVLASKAENAGRRVEAVEPAYTSQDCSMCGFRVKKKLSERIHSCPNCGLVLDRDHNAAINILNAVGQHSDAG